MQRENVKQVIQDLATQLLSVYPEVTMDIAQVYWDSRSDEEIDRDKSLGITAEDYAKWVEEIQSKIWTAHIKWHGENYGLAIINKGSNVRQTPVIRMNGVLHFDDTLTDRERQILLSL